ncbi:(Fe-S)-binding protein [Staphylococcus ratti]|uniref:Glycolate oxidase iron-sulfur subunit n=1 Tax=Staphylococcus ratti TaxID=2892440 RepID=A0ABY3PDQ1_9STAP|nr:(Fe-S)-binding protein [Staphylococcus ratti]UEX90419.1 (Fe-S)-binding protein [Staphylococcus ratti]
MTNLKSRLDYQATFDCVQCGYCLPVCPTYVSFKNEKHSPRGRINLVKLAAENKVTLEDMAESIELCLGCRACETVCPTHVNYGDILSSAVEVLYEEKAQSNVEKVIRYTAFQGLLKHPKALRLVNKGLRFYQKSGVETIITATGALKFAPKYQQFQKILPKVHKTTPQHKGAFSRQKSMTVGFFQGCMMDAIFSHINDLAIKIMEQHDIQVMNVAMQTCCGALQHHAGQTAETISLAKRNIETYERYDFDYIVNTIGGCGAALKEYDKLFEKGTSWHERATKFVNKVRDISEILAAQTLVWRTQLNAQAIYQPSCHLENVQKVFKALEHVLNAIPGLTLLPFENQHHCCGSAGIYNLVNYEAEMQILDDKMHHVQKVKPNLIITSNPGCHLQMKLGVEREGLSSQIEVKHLVEVVAEACQIN